jgi:hypothetical protein
MSMCVCCKCVVSLLGDWNFMLEREDRWMTMDDNGLPSPPPNGPVPEIEIVWPDRDFIERRFAPLLFARPSRLRLFRSRRCTYT